jgi:glucose-1-phosphate adenylyltransferase
MTRSPSFSPAAAVRAWPNSPTGAPSRRCRSGGKFRIIDFALSNCVNSGIRRIGICTQYKAHSLIRHVQRCWSFLDGRFGEFVELLPAQQRITADWYQGTADALYQNIDLLRRHGRKYVLILAGDHVYKMDYTRMLADHATSGAVMSVACIEAPLSDANQFGVMTVDANWRISAFDEKPAQPAAMPDQASADMLAWPHPTFWRLSLYACYP